MSLRVERKSLDRLSGVRSASKRRACDFLGGRETRVKETSRNRTGDKRSEAGSGINMKIGQAPDR